MSKRKHARIPAPKTVTVIRDYQPPTTNEWAEYELVTEPVTPLRNRAERRAAVKQLMNRGTNRGNAPDRRPVPGVR